MAVAVVGRFGGRFEVSAVREGRRRSTRVGQLSREELDEIEAINLD